MKRLLLILAGLAVLAGVGAYWALWASAGPKEGPHTIIVEDGSTLTKVAGQLDEIGAIPGSATTFRAMARGDRRALALGRARHIAVVREGSWQWTENVSMR